jgi:hypothetical protein
MLKNTGDKKSYDTFPLSMKVFPPSIGDEAGSLERNFYSSKCNE